MVGVILFLVIVTIAVGSIWLLIPTSPQQSQQSEQLQESQMLGAYTLPAGDPTLTTCVSQSGSVLTFKVNLRIILNGTPIVIPNKIGNKAGCLRPLHTIDDTGDVYVESPVFYSYTLQDFFAVWGQVFTKDQIFTLHADSGHEIRMTVNGVPNSQFQDYVLASGDQITITFA